MQSKQQPATQGSSTRTNFQMMTILNVVVAITMGAKATPFVSHMKLQPNTSFFSPKAPSTPFEGGAAAAT